jgi:excisionase family DNA binding protein
MSRQTPAIFLALSVAATSTALAIQPRHVYRAIEEGKLPVFQIGIKRRILVSDIEKWVRGWKKPKRKKRKVPNA